ncbi:uncharacterized protein LOC123538163, partial [Mercenaria mercenaria]|uniref:uncharacterized protein LOC123538163 n=1 Tax=Mercenaria mercenaria TaxID=6596 RepID=UPI00234ED86A
MTGTTQQGGSDHQGSSQTTEITNGQKTNFSTTECSNEKFKQQSIFEMPQNEDPDQLSKENIKDKVADTTEIIQHGSSDYQGPSQTMAITYGTITNGKSLSTTGFADEKSNQQSTFGAFSENEDNGHLSKENVNNSIAETKGIMQQGKYDYQRTIQTDESTNDQSVGFSTADFGHGKASQQVTFGKEKAQSEGTKQKFASFDTKQPDRIVQKEQEKSPVLVRAARKIPAIFTDGNVTDPQNEDPDQLSKENIKDKVADTTEIMQHGSSDYQGPSQTMTITNDNITNGQRLSSTGFSDEKSNQQSTFGVLSQNEDNGHLSKKNVNNSIAETKGIMQQGKYLYQRTIQTDERTNDRSVGFSTADFGHGKSSQQVTFGKEIPAILTDGNATDPQNEDPD